MQSKNSTFISVLVKTDIILVAGLLISIIVLSSVDTYSFFTSASGGTMMVSAATTPDIIKTVEVANTDPMDITLERADDLTYDPIVFFSVEGDAAKYIAHINPQKVESGKKVIIPIDININLPAVIKLILASGYGENAAIEGTLRIKHMNNFIDEPKEFKFTVGYLLDEYFEDLRESGKSKKELYADIDEKGSERVTSYLTDMITYTAGYGTWDKVKTSDEKNIASISTVDAALSDEGGIKNPVSKLEMSDQQISIIDIVMPELRAHLDKLYGTIEDFIAKFKSKDEEIGKLIEDKKVKDGQIEADASQIDALKVRIKELEDENAKLKAVPPKADNESLSDRQSDEFIVPPQSEDQNNGDQTQGTSVTGQDTQQSNTDNTLSPPGGEIVPSPSLTPTGVSGQGT